MLQVKQGYMQYTATRESSQFITRCCLRCLLRSQETYEHLLSTAAAAILSLSVLAAGSVGIVEADHPTSGTNRSIVANTRGNEGCLYSFIG